MPVVPQTYERNLHKAKYYDNTIIGSKGYNPIITEYYTSADELIRVEEVWAGNRYSQTISGSNYASDWPTYNYSVTYNAWEVTTVS